MTANNRDDKVLECVERSPALNKCLKQNQKQLLNEKAQCTTAQSCAAAGIAINVQVLLQVGYFITSSPELLPN
jgi:hypothetical protein